MALRVMKRMSKQTKATDLSVIQSTLEHATHELKLAQAGFTKASDRLQVAEEAHTLAMVALANSVNSVKSSNKVLSLALK